MELHPFFERLSKLRTRAHFLKSQRVAYSRIRAKILIPEGQTVYVETTIKTTEDEVVTKRLGTWRTLLVNPHEIKADEGAAPIIGASLVDEEYVTTAILSGCFRVVQSEAISGWKASVIAVLSDELDLLIWLRRTAAGGCSRQYLAVIAILSDATEVLEFLLENSPPSHYSSSLYLHRIEGSNLLQLALGVGHLRCAQILHSAFPKMCTLRDREGLTVSHYAAFGGNFQAYLWLLDKVPHERHPARLTPAMVAAVSDRKDFLHAIGTSDREQLTALDAENFTIAHYAAGAGASRALAVLKEHDIELILPPPDTKVSTLMVAAFFGELGLPSVLRTLYPQELALALMESDMRGRLALHYAVWGRIPETIDFFCKLVLPDFEYGVHMLLDACEEFDCADVFKAVMRRFPEYQLHLASWLVVHKPTDLLAFLEARRLADAPALEYFTPSHGAPICDEAFPPPKDEAALLIQYYGDFLEEGMAKWLQPLASAQEPTPRWLDLGREQTIVH